MTDPFQQAVGLTGLVFIFASTLGIVIVAARRVGIGTGIVAGLTWYVGSACTFLAMAHLVAVVWTAVYVHTTFSYNFRFAALMLVGVWLIIGGALCVTAAGEVLRRHPPHWRRAVIGALLLALTAGPLVPLQPELATGVVTAAATDLVVIIGFLARGGASSRVARHP